MWRPHSKFAIVAQRYSVLLAALWVGSASAQPLLTARLPAPSTAPPAPLLAPETPALAEGAIAKSAPGKPVPQPEGVVLVERGGRTIALGSVLAVDGRVLSAWSRVSGAGPLTLRYSDGSQEPARVGHFDESRDLALLVPETRRWTKGLIALRGFPPAGVPLTALNPAQNRSLLPVQEQVSVTHDAGAMAFKLSEALKPEALGGPLLDAKGQSAGVVVGCKPAAPNCSLGRPVDEIRKFLRALPVSAGYVLPRLGISGRSIDTGAVRGLLLTSIESDSPAAALKLRAGETKAEADVLVAIAGTPVPTLDSFRATLARHRPGSKVELLLFSKGEYRTVNTTLAAPKKAEPTAAPSPIR